MRPLAHRLDLRRLIYSLAIASRAAILVIAALIAAFAIAGCGSDSGSTTQQATPAPSDEGFPTNGTTTGPNVTTTAGEQAKLDPDAKAGGGSGATCIGC